MIRLKKIVCATDFSSCSDAALDVAAQASAEYGAELHVIHVIELPGSESDQEAAFRMDIQRFLLPARSAAMSNLIHLAERLHERDAKVGAMVLEEGSPSKMILRYTSENDIDLVTIGTHGRVNKSDLMVGREAQKILRMSPVPVLTVRRPLIAERRISLSTITVPIDFSANSQLALEHAAALALRHGSVIHLVHVLMNERKPLQNLGIFLDDASLLRSQAKQARAELTRLASAFDLQRYFVAVLPGLPAPAIAQYTNQTDTNLIVMGAGCVTQYESLGSVADKVVRMVNCPVLTVRNRGGRPTADNKPAAETILDYG